MVANVTGIHRSGPKLQVDNRDFAQSNGPWSIASRLTKLDRCSSSHQRKWCTEEGHPSDGRLKFGKEKICHVDKSCHIWM